jgi:cytochrome c6
VAVWFSNAGVAKDEKAARCRFPEAAAPWRGAGAKRLWMLMPMLMLLLLLMPAWALAADTHRGAELYRSHCIGCHGAGGKPVMPGAPDFSRPTALLKPDLVLLAVVRQGRAAMPAYAGQLRDRDILDVVSHLRTFK